MEKKPTVVGFVTFGNMPEGRRLLENYQYGAELLSPTFTKTIIV